MSAFILPSPDQDLTYRGCDALQCSVEGGHEDVFKLLLEHGCDPLACDHLGATLLHYAANGGNLEIIKQLLRLGCNKDAVTQYGRTVLHYAAFSKRLPCTLIEPPSLWGFRC